ncbi:hypothetical protein SL034_001534 [Vibrio harveyi]|nr:hypothetical protein [Vibrio harveyi]
MIKAFKLILTDSRPHASPSLKTVNDLFLSFEPIRNVGKISFPHRLYQGGTFNALGDPLIAPDLMVYPKDITTLQARQSIMLYAFDQRAAYYTLTGVTVNGDGISITGQTSGRVIVGASKHYELILDTTRPGGIVGEVIWHFSDHPDVIATIDAANPSIWFYKPTYPIKEDWRFATAVIESKKSEERIQNAPHPTCSFTYEHHEKEEQLVTSLEKLRNYGSAPILVPWWLDAIPSISVNKGDVSIPVKIGSRRFFDTALLYKSKDDYEVVRIANQSSSALFFKRPVSKTYSNVMLIPLLNCIATSGNDYTQSGRTAKAKVTFSTVDPLRINPLDWEDNYLNKPVLFRYRKPQKHEVKHDWKQKVTQSNVPHFTKHREVVLDSLDFELLERDVAAFQRRMKRLYGRAQAFWVIDKKIKIELAEVSTMDRITIKPINFAELIGSECDLYLNIDSHRHYIHARLSSVDAKGNEVLELTTTSRNVLKPSQLVESGLLRLVRSESDNVSFTHRHGLTNVSLSLRQIER